MNSFDNIDREYAYDGELGAVWSPEATRFAVWSPEAEGAELRLYHDDSEPEPFRTEEMHSENGVWKAGVSGDLSGQYYPYAWFSISVPPTRRAGSMTSRSPSATTPTR